MFGFSKTHKELEFILMKLHANASNNYKDAAQDNYREYLQKLEMLKQTGKLTKRQMAYYEECSRKLESEMKHYSHKDQKADFHGLGELKAQENKK